MNTKIYVGNLLPLTTAEDLRQLFSSVGGVSSVNVIKEKKSGKSKGFAFVEMLNQGDTGKAVSEFNGLILDQRCIKVKPAKMSSKPLKPKIGFVEYKSYNESGRKPYSRKRRY
jgi:RNA recognition motif-containing protein